MSNRLHKWLRDLENELTGTEIAAGLGNGDIIPPGDWLSVAESIDHVKIWDNETGGSQHMGFVALDYGERS